MFRYLIAHIGSWLLNKQYRAEQRRQQQLIHEIREMDAALAHFRAIRIHNPSRIYASLDDTSTAQPALLTNAECNRLDFVRWLVASGRITVGKDE